MKTTRISAWVAAGLVVGTALFTACSKSDDTPSLPPIGGYNSSNEVAAANLLAHWPFDGSNNERISSTAPSTSKNASFSTGASGKGQSLNLAGGFVLFPTIAKLSSANAIGSVTVSAWINTTNNGKSSSSVFALTQALTAQGDWNDGPINMYLENSKPASKGDTLTVHSAFHTFRNNNYLIGGDNINDFGIAGTDYLYVKGGGKWIHYVMVYDGAASTIDLYVNNVLVSNKKYRERKGGSPEALIGPLAISTPTQVVIGGWPNADTGYTKSAVQTWQGLFTGGIDEVRVYGKALTSNEIGSLYQLESAGR